MQDAVAVPTQAECVLLPLTIRITAYEKKCPLSLTNQPVFPGIYVPQSHAVVNFANKQPVAGCGLRAGHNHH